MEYINKRKDNFVKIINKQNNFEMLADSIFVYFNINGKRSHLPLNKLIEQFENSKKHDWNNNNCRDYNDLLVFN